MKKKSITYLLTDARVCLQLLEQQAGASDDFQEASAEEKEAFKRKYSMDVALEDKICDLYDHFVEVLLPHPKPHPHRLKTKMSSTRLLLTGTVDVGDLLGLYL